MINLPVFKKSDTHLNGSPAFCKLKRKNQYTSYDIDSAQVILDMTQEETYIAAWDLDTNFYIFHNGILYPANENDFEFSNMCELEYE